MLWLSTLVAWPSHAADSPAVALASSFRTIWPSLLSAYVQETGASSPRASFASSGLLTTQIRHGAPFDIYLSADSATITTLYQSGKANDQGVLLAYGTLSLVAPKSAYSDDDLSLDSIAQRLKRGPIKIALPNPRHAPYGIAAQEALANVGLWPLPEQSVLAGENASQTLQYALSGTVDFALVPTVLLIPPPESLSVKLLDISHYKPIEHHLLLLNSASPEAIAAYNWLQGPTAQAVLQAHGLRAIR